MLHQAALRREAGIANLAAERPLAGVHARVNHKLRGGNKPSRAVVAPVGPNVAVPPLHVILQAVLAANDRRTLGTLHRARPPVRRQGAGKVFDLRLHGGRGGLRRRRHCRNSRRRGRGRHLASGPAHKGLTATSAAAPAAPGGGKVHPVLLLHVLHQVAVDGEAKAAHGADVRPLAGVHPIVHLQLGVGHKGPLAALKVASVGAVVAVPPGDVLLQPVLVLHLLAAVRTLAQGAAVVHHPDVLNEHLRAAGKVLAAVAAATLQVARGGGSGSEGVTSIDLRWRDCLKLLSSSREAPMSLRGMRPVNVRLQLHRIAEEGVAAAAGKGPPLMGANVIGEGAPAANHLPTVRTLKGLASSGGGGRSGGS